MARNEGRKEEIKLLKGRLKKATHELERTRRSLNQRLKELSFLSRASRILSSTLGLNLIYQLSIETIAKIMKVKIASLLLIDKESGFLIIKAAQGLEEEIIENTRVNIGEGISGWVVKYGKPLLIDDIEKNSRFRRINSERYNTKSLVSVPLKAKGRYTAKARLSVPLVVKGGAIGVLNVNNKASGEVFNETDLQVITILAEQIAFAIENVSLYEKEKKEVEHLEKAVKERTAELEELKIFTETILGSTANPIIVFTLNGRITYVNSACLKMFGYASDKEIVGKAIDEVSEIFVNPEEDIEKMEGLFRQVLKKGVTEQPLEIRLQRPDRSREFLISVLGSLVKNTDGSSKSVVETWRDITELKTAQEIEKELAAEVARTEEERKSRKALEAEVNELEEFQDLAVGRELKMIKLKKEIERLKAKIENQTSKEKKLKAKLERERDEPEKKALKQH